MKYAKFSSTEFGNYILIGSAQSHHSAQLFMGEPASGRGSSIK